MSSFVTLQMSSHIHYLLPSDHKPTLYRFGDGILLVNPVLLDAHQGAARVLFRAPSGDLWFLSPMLTLCLDSSLKIPPSYKADDNDVVGLVPLLDKLHELIDRPLATLRIVSRQWGVGREFICCSTGHSVTISEEMLQSDKDNDNWTPGIVFEVNALYPTSVTRKHLNQLFDESFIDYVHEGLLLDAFGAYMVEDFRTCLIYAAFAAEAAAGRWLADKYNAILSERPSHLRIRDVQANSQTAILPKDDVWEFLNGTSQNVCKQLFHLRPIYLTKRSISIEDQNLYSRLEKNV